MTETPQKIRLDLTDVEESKKWIEKLLTLNQPQKAETIGKLALQQHPDNEEILALVIDSLDKQNKLDEFEQDYLTRLKDKDPATVYGSLADLYYKFNKTQQAKTYYQKAIDITPKPEIIYNLAMTYKKLNQDDQAEKHFLKALSLDPNLTQAQFNLAQLLDMDHRYKEAETYYQQFLKANPDHAPANWNYALLLLKMGNLKKGWQQYEWGWQAKERNNNLTLDLTQWQGEPLKNKTILLCLEQGIGDEIMFASCLPDIIKTQAKISLLCTPRLQPLFERTYPKITVYPATVASMQTIKKTPFDYYSPLGSLPKHYRQTFSQFPKHKSYLKADKILTKQLKETYKKNNKPIIGISWVGGIQDKTRETRSIIFDNWQPLFQLPNIHLLSVQHGETKKALQHLKDQYGITMQHDETVNGYKDMDRFAAQLNACDLIITADNSTAHLAGALGKPVWTLLQWVADFRWFDNRTDTPWYPTMRLFRQPQKNDWQSVIKEVTQELNKLLNET